MQKSEDSKKTLKDKEILDIEKSLSPQHSRSNAVNVNDGKKLDGIRWNHHDTLRSFYNSKKKGKSIKIYIYC
jgi:hypothetical protein